MIGRRVGTTGGGVNGGGVNGGGGSGGATIAASTRVAGSGVAGIVLGAGAAVTVGEFPDGRRDIRSRRQLRDQGFDLAPASATGPGEDGFVVRRREVPPQQPDGGE